VTHVTSVSGSEPLRGQSRALIWSSRARLSAGTRSAGREQSGPDAASAELFPPTRAWVICPASYTTSDGPSPAVEATGAGPAGRYPARMDPGRARRACWPACRTLPPQLVASATRWPPWPSCLLVRSPWQGRGCGTRPRPGRLPTFRLWDRHHQREPRPPSPRLLRAGRGAPPGRTSPTALRRRRTPTRPARHAAALLPSAARRGRGQAFPGKHGQRQTVWGRRSSVVVPDRPGALAELLAGRRGRIRRQPSRICGSNTPRGSPEGAAELAGGARGPGQDWAEALRADGWSVTPRCGGGSLTPHQALSGQSLDRLVGRGRGQRGSWAKELGGPVGAGVHPGALVVRHRRAVPGSR